jgi:hypothetical protein
MPCDKAIARPVRQRTAHQRRPDTAARAAASPDRAAMVEALVFRKKPVEHGRSRSAIEEVEREAAHGLVVKLLHDHLFLICLSMILSDLPTPAEAPSHTADGARASRRRDRFPPRITSGAGFFGIMLSALARDAHVLRAITLSFRRRY